METFDEEITFLILSASTDIGKMYSPPTTSNLDKESCLASTNETIESEKRVKINTLDIRLSVNSNLWRPESEEQIF